MPQSLFWARFHVDRRNKLIGFYQMLDRGRSNRTVNHLMTLSPVSKLKLLVPLALALFIATARANFVETFSNGSDDGNWHLTDNPDRLLQIEASGGNPGAYLHGQVFTPVPVWYVPFATSPTHFLGNYYAQQVGGISFDLNIFSGTQAPNRAVTLDLLSTLGTGDFSQGLEAYKIGANISTLPIGWKRYSFSLDATSTSIPPGWVVLRGDGSPGTDADWQRLMQDVETIGFELGKPGFAYPALNGWDLGLDNVRISQDIPDSGPGMMFPFTVLLLIFMRRIAPPRALIPCRKSRF
jgi:hypothetical protein